MNETDKKAKSDARFAFILLFCVLLAYFLYGVQKAFDLPVFNFGTILLIDDLGLILIWLFCRD